MGERSVFTGAFKERVVELGLKTDRKQSEIAQIPGSSIPVHAAVARTVPGYEEG
jgi:hypothetical protein